MYKIIKSFNLYNSWANLAENELIFFLYPWHMKYAERVYSFCRFSPFVCLSVCPSVLPSILPSVRPSVIRSVNPFDNQVLLQSFLIIYNSAATNQKLFIFGIVVPWRVLFHSISMNPWVMPRGGARGQNLGHTNKVVYCSLFTQTTS